MSTAWGADVPISMPEPLEDGHEVEVPMYGFAFTLRGLFHDLGVVDHERLSRPTFAPTVDPQEPVIYGDTHG